MTRISEAVEALESLGYTVTPPAEGKLIVRESIFGHWLDFGFRNAEGLPARTIIVGSRVNGNFQPRKILLPHQLYVANIERMKERGATDVAVHPIYDAFHVAWTLAKLEQKTTQAVSS